MTSKRATPSKKAADLLTKRPSARSAPTSEQLEYAVKAQPWKPHAYQKKGVKFLLEHAGAALFLDPGLGKTSITLSALKVLKSEEMSGISLVIAPLRICHSVWPNEVKKWTNFEHMTVKVLHGSKKEDVLAEGADIMCVNPEGLEWLFGVTKTKLKTGKVRIDVDRKRLDYLFKKLNMTDLIIDESTKFKRAGSQRFKILKLVLQYFKRRWILTGTPAPNGMMDLFAQIFIVDLGRSFTPFITHYRKRFFNSVGFGGFTYVLKPGAEAEIYKIIKPLVLRLDAKDYLELPEIIPNPVKLTLPDAAMAVYTEMEDELVVELSSGIVTAASGAAAMGKCEQIANGGLYKQADALLAGKRRKGHEGWTLIHEAKNDATVDIVDELNGQPVIIAYQFDHDLDRLRGVFGKDTPYIGGGVSAAEGKRIEADWNRGRIPVLLLQPQSAAHGLNLQNASDAEVGHVVWYSLTSDLELFDQLNKRVARQGSKHKRVIVHMLVARKTVDEAKVTRLASKDKRQTALLDALRTYVASRGRAKPAAATVRASRGRQAARLGAGAAAKPAKRKA